MDLLVVSSVFLPISVCVDVLFGWTKYFKISQHFVLCFLPKLKMPLTYT